EGMLAAERGIERLRTALAGDEPQETVHQPSTINHQPDPPVSPASVPQPVERARAAFITAMNDDFNTPGAIAALFDLAREANRQRESGDAASAAAARSTLRELASVLGLRLSPAAGTDLAAAPFVELLLKVRGDLRAARQFALADGIRGDLAGLGIHVEDRPDGTSAWRPGAA
ncbi:MAG TPA: DALR domain-containing protein, partial [Candidatus Limnocylindrales bacterium]|nr:DALR domain-containing protein [Candidatus Limnocylindrales bacterium]